MKLTIMGQLVLFRRISKRRRELWDSFNKKLSPKYAILTSRDGFTL